MAPLNNDDLVMINNADKSYKVKASVLFEDKYKDCYVLVNVGSKSYRCKVSSLVAKAASDQWMFVNQKLPDNSYRSYRVSSVDIVNKFAAFILKPTVVAPIDGAGMGPIKLATDIITNVDIDVADARNQTLTLQSNKGIDLLSVGDLVGQGPGGYLPVTDAIVKVEGKADGWKKGYGTMPKNAGGLAYGKGIWISMNYDKHEPFCIKSTDNGVNWSQYNTSNGAMNVDRYYSVHFGNNGFMALGHNADNARKMIWSSDTNNWAQRGNGGTDRVDWRASAYGAGKWVVIGNKNSHPGGGQDTRLCITSTDNGANWTRHDASALDLGIPKDLKYENNRFILTGSYQQGPIRWSDDGITWYKPTATYEEDGTPIPDANNSTWNKLNSSSGSSLYLGNDRWIMLPSTGNMDPLKESWVAISEDNGLTWTLKFNVIPHLENPPGYPYQSWSTCFQNGRIWMVNNLYNTQDLCLISDDLGESFRLGAKMPLTAGGGGNRYYNTHGANGRVVVTGNEAAYTDDSAMSLTVKSDQDLKYFRSGDTIQGSDIVTTRIDIPNKKVGVSGGDWYADPSNGGDGSGNTYGDRMITCKSEKKPENWTVTSIDVANNKVSFKLDGAYALDNTQVWVANDNYKNEEFFIDAGEVANPPLMPDNITLESSVFATDRPSPAVFTNAQWTIKKTGGATQTLDGGANTSYKPPGGTFDFESEYKVSVVHQADILSDSEPSDEITFRTGVAPLTPGDWVKSDLAVVLPAGNSGVTGVGWDGTQFLALCLDKQGSNNSKLIRSTDGHNWTSLGNPFPMNNTQPMGLVYGNGKWVIAANGGSSGNMRERLLTSDNGVDWVPPQYNGKISAITNLHYSDQSGYFTLESSLRSFVSKDGVVWDELVKDSSSTTIAMGSDWSGVMWNPISKKWFISSRTMGGNMWENANADPTDGTWTLVSSVRGTVDVIQSIGINPDTGVMIITGPSSPGSRQYRSKDGGDTWQQITFNSADKAQNMLYHGGVWWNNTYRSDKQYFSKNDGDTWTIKPTTEVQDWGYIDWTGDRWWIWSGVVNRLQYNVPV